MPQYGCIVAVGNTINLETGFPPDHIAGSARPRVMASLLNMLVTVTVIVRIKIMHLAVIPMLNGIVMERPCLPRGLEAGA